MIRKSLLSPIFPIFLILALSFMPIRECAVRWAQTEQQYWLRAYVEPTNTTAVIYTTFKINVSVNVLEYGIISYELKLYYDNRLLKGVDVLLPEGHFLTPSIPENLYIFAREINQTFGFAYVAVSLLGSEQDNPRLGNGTLVTVTLKAEQPGSPNLTIQDYTFVTLDCWPFWGEVVLDGLVEIVLPDFNGDERVDTSDLAIIRSAFGSQPSDARWNAVCDVNHDSKINIVDVAVTARAFGKTATK